MAKNPAGELDAQYVVGGVFPTMTPPPISVGGCRTQTRNTYWVFLYSYDCILFDMFFHSIVCFLQMFYFRISTPILNFV